MISNNTLLLKIIDSRASLSLLRDRGLSHSQIAMLIEEQKNEGNIIVTESEIKLSPKGSMLLANNLSEHTIKEKDQWILPQEHLYKKPIDSKIIVLPKRRKI